MFEPLFLACTLASSTCVAVVEDPPKQYDTMAECQVALSDMRDAVLKSFPKGTRLRTARLCHDPAKAMPPLPYWFATPGVDV